MHPRNPVPTALTVRSWGTTLLIRSVSGFPQRAESSLTGTGLAEQVPCFAILFERGMAVVPGAKGIERNVQSPSQSANWNQIPELLAVVSLAAEHCGQEVDLLLSVGHLFAAGPPAGPHAESILRHVSAAPDLHAPNPSPPSIKDYIEPPVIATGLVAPKSPI